MLIVSNPHARVERVEGAHGGPILNTSYNFPMGKGIG